MGILLKPSISTGYLISCPLWSKFSPPSPGCQKGNTVGFLVISRLEKAASSHLHRKGSLHGTVFENKLFRRETASFFEDFYGFRGGQNKSKQLWFPNIPSNLCRPLDTEICINPILVLWVQKCLF